MPHEIDEEHRARDAVRGRGEKVGPYVSIRRRDGTWYANWQRGGRQHRRSLKTQSKKEAVTRAWRIERDVEEAAEGVTKPAEPARIEEVITAYRDSLAAAGRAAKTVAKYDLVMRRVADLAGRRRVVTIDAVDLGFLDAYRAERRRDGEAAKTIYTESVVVRQLAKFAFRRKLVAEDPLAGAELKKPKPTAQPCWAVAEAERIVAAAREPFATAFAVLLDTGLREEELLHLTKADVDFRANVLHVRPKDGWTPKTGDARAVPMTPRVAERLRPRVERLRATDWVFAAAVTAKHVEEGRRLRGRRLLGALKRVTARLGLPGHVHTFRHTFISNAVLHGVPEAVIRKWVGHVDPQILRLYTHIHDGAGQAEMRRLAEAVRGAGDVA